MHHPLTRIFAPICMIVLVAAFTVVTTTVDTTGRLPLSVVAISTAAAEATQLSIAGINENTVESRN